MAWTTPRTWSAGETVTETIMNTHVRDNLKAIGDAWTSYTPTLSWTLGNGSLSGHYIQAGKLVHARVQFTVGSTTSASGGLIIGLPVSARNIGAVTKCPVGGAVILDTSATARFIRFACLNTVAGIEFDDLSAASVNASTPMAWATGDTLQAYVNYEAA